MGKKIPPSNIVRKMATDAALRNLLRKAGPGQTMSQSEIAEQTGLSRKLINRIERGAIEKVTEQIARILERGEDGSA
jgi:predicted transcriptional regulator